MKNCVDVHDSQLESWLEKNGTGQAVFKRPVGFVKLHGKFTEDMLYLGNRYSVTWVSVDRRQVTFRKIVESLKKETTKRVRKPKKNAAPNSEPFHLEQQQQAYVPHDRHGSREAGEAAALENAHEAWKAAMRAACDAKVRRADFVDVISPDLTAIAGPPPPPSHPSGPVGPLMRRIAKELGLVAIGTRNSGSKRSAHIVNVWGFPDGINPYIK